jgi:hypothetical protein
MGAPVFAGALPRTRGAHGCGVVPRLSSLRGRRRTLPRPRVGADVLVLLTEENYAAQGRAVAEAMVEAAPQEWLGYRYCGGLNPNIEVSSVDVRVQACSVQGGANPPQVNLLRPVADRNCVAVRRGGEQRKANRVVRSESKLDSAALTGEPAS